MIQLSLPTRFLGRLIAILTYFLFLTIHKNSRTLIVRESSLKKKFLYFESKGNESKLLAYL